MALVVAVSSDVSVMRFHVRRGVPNLAVRLPPWKDTQQKKDYEVGNRKTRAATFVFPLVHNKHIGLVRAMYCIVLYCVYCIVSNVRAAWPATGRPHHSSTASENQGLSLIAVSRLPNVESR